MPGGVFNRVKAFMRRILNAEYSDGNFPGCLHRFFSKGAHFIRHNGKTPPGIARTGGLNCCIQRQQVGLIGYFTNYFHDRTDILRTLAQKRHRFLQVFAGGRYRFNGLDRGAHLRLASLGFFPRSLRIAGSRIYTF